MTFEEEQDDSPSTRDQVFDFLVRYKQAHDGNSPSLREVAAACNIALSGAHYHLTRLQMDNRIRFGGKSRTIEIMGGTWQLPEHAAVEGGEQSQDHHAREDHHHPSGEAASHNR